MVRLIKGFCNSSTILPYIGNVLGTTNIITRRSLRYTTIMGKFEHNKRLRILLLFTSQEQICENQEI